MEVLLNGRKIVEKVFQPKSNEKVLIITDSEKFDLSKMVANVFKDLGVQVTLWTIPQTMRPLKEINSTLSNLLIGSDITIYLLSRNIQEKPFRVELSKQGRKNGRICMLTGITKELYPALLVDYREMSSVNFALKKKIKSSKKINVSCPNGTKVSFSLEGRKIYLDHGLINEKGIFGYLPAGAVHSAPIEESFEGTIATKQIEEIMFDNPVLIEFKQGKMISYKAHATEKEKAKKLFSLIENAAKTPGDDAKSIGEFAIGTNSSCKASGNNLLERTKARGSVQFALGSSNGLGKSKSSIHVDFIVDNATVRVNDEILIKENKLVL